MVGGGGMTVIIYYRDNMDRWEGITKIVKVPGILNLYRGIELVKQVTCAMKLEVV